MELQKARESLIKETRKKIKAYTTEDILIIQAVSDSEGLNRAISILIKDLREWYSYYNPEFSRENPEQEVFIEEIIGKRDKKTKDSMGADLDKEELAPILNLANGIKALYALKKKQEEYIEDTMQKKCPNITKVAGSLIGAKLLKHAGSLKRLAILPSSTVQLLGAEEALFRHIKTGAKCPKHGILFAHPLVSKSNKKDAGRVARVLASKISIASRVDYMKGKFIGDKLLKEVEEKIR